MNGLVEVIKDELNKLKKMLTQTGTDYIATVTSVEGQTAHVRIAGSDISDTPVAMSINAKAGDTVRVRVKDGKAWITGNDTAPPTDDTKAIELIENTSQGVMENAAKYSRIDQSIDEIRIEVGEKMNSDMTNRASSIAINSGKMTFNSNTLVVNSSKFTLDESGNATFGGTLNAAGGSFKGKVQIDGNYGTQGTQKIELTSDGIDPIAIYKTGTTGMNTQAFLGSQRLLMQHEVVADYSASHMIDLDVIQGIITVRDYDMFLSTRIYQDKVWVGVNAGSYTEYRYDGQHISSDRRLKHDIIEIDPKMAKKLHPVRFKFRGDDKIHYGFIAQEVQKVHPDAVTEDGAGILSLNYQDLIAPLYALVQDQEKRITQLEERLKALEDKL